MKRHSIYLIIVFFLAYYSISIAQKHVRVRVHIINNCITQQTAINEIHKLNTNYYNGSGILFMLDQIDAITNNSYNNLATGAFACNFIQSDIFQHNVSNSLNIYIVPNIVNGAKGFAESIIGNACVLSQNNMGSEITAHEVGHCLGLFHTSEQDCNGLESITRNKFDNCYNANIAGDLVEDTQPYRKGSDATPTDDCGNTYPDSANPQNIMNREGGTRTVFTPGQMVRMLNKLSYNLSNIVFDPIKEVLVKNSFGSGQMIIDNASPISIPSSGKLNDNWHHSSFPHSFKAIDSQLPSGNLYIQKYQDWNSPLGTNSNILVAVLSPLSFLTDIYTANFLSQFNVTFRNSFGGGTIKIDNANPESSPTSIHYVNENKTIKGQALYQVINGIEYIFDYWSHSGGTNSTKIFSVTGGHKDYIAYFEPGKPENSYRNLHFNNSRDPVGTSIKVMWNQHPNSNVTKYKIYRQTKFGSPQLIKTVNRTSASSYTSIDNAYAITNKVLP